MNLPPSPAMTLRRIAPLLLLTQMSLVHFPSTSAGQHRQFWAGGPARGYMPPPTAPIVDEYSPRQSPFQVPPLPQRTQFSIHYPPAFDTPPAAPQQPQQQFPVQTQPPPQPSYPASPYATDEVNYPPNAHQQLAPLQWRPFPVPPPPPSTTQSIPTEPPLLINTLIQVFSQKQLKTEEEVRPAIALAEARTLTEVSRPVATGSSSVQPNTALTHLNGEVKRRVTLSRHLDTRRGTFIPEAAVDADATPAEIAFVKAFAATNASKLSEAQLREELDRELDQAIPLILEELDRVDEKGARPREEQTTKLAEGAENAEEERRRMEEEERKWRAKQAEDQKKREEEERRWREERKRVEEEYEKRRGEEEKRAREQEEQTGAETTPLGTSDLESLVGEGLEELESSGTTGGTMATTPKTGQTPPEMEGEETTPANSGGVGITQVSQETSSTIGMGSTLGTLEHIKGEGSALASGVEGEAQTTQEAKTVIPEMEAEDTPFGGLTMPHVEGTPGTESALLPTAEGTTVVVEGDEHASMTTTSSDEGPTPVVASYTGTEVHETTIVKETSEMTTMTATGGGATMEEDRASTVVAPFVVEGATPEVPKTETLAEEVTSEVRPAEEKEVHTTRAAEAETAPAGREESTVSAGATPSTTEEVPFGTNVVGMGQDGGVSTEAGTGQSSTQAGGAQETTTAVADGEGPKTHGVAETEGEGTTAGGTAATGGDQSTLQQLEMESTGGGTESAPPAGSTTGAAEESAESSTEAQPTAVTGGEVVVPPPEEQPTASTVSAFDGGNISVECLPDGIMAILTPSSPANHSTLFAKGFHDDPECYSEEQNGRIELRIGEGRCGLSRMESTAPAGSNMSLVLIFATSRTLVLSPKEHSFLLQCHLPFAPPSTLLHTDLSVLPRPAPLSRTISLEVPPPKCEYSLRRDSPNGPVVERAAIGQTIYHRWECGGQRAAQVFGMHVAECSVANQTETEGGEPLHMVDTIGCSSDPTLLSQPQYSADRLLSFARATVFSLRDTDSLRFACRVSLCVRALGQCEGISPPSCANSSEPSAALFSRRLLRDFDASMAEALSTEVLSPQFSVSASTPSAVSSPPRQPFMGMPPSPQQKRLLSSPLAIVLLLFSAILLGALFGIFSFLVAARRRKQQRTRVVHWVLARPPETDSDTGGNENDETFFDTSPCRGLTPEADETVRERRI